ncbi:hypothetical protein, partial [Pseudomonas carnis]|uniref:hypothetical protein n=1 Tax=Pseudomonas carnis TaxID=2487355 RepID=UPI001969350A
HDLTLFSFNSSYVNPNWVAQGRYEYRLLRTYLDGLGHGTKLRMEFKAAVSLSKVEAEAISFPVVEYTVNTLPAEFPVPKLTQATGTGTSVTLAPLNAQNGATVSVEYTPMYTTDSIKVTMVGTAGAGSPVIPAKNGVTTGKVTFDITKAAIAANVGNANKTLTLKYDVTRSGKVVASKVLTVTVTPIPTTELAKTVIRINEADAATKVLDLSGSVTNKTLRVGSWPFIASFQPVAMLLSGFKADGSVHELQVWTLASNAVTAGWFSNGFYDQRVAASYFLELGHDTKLKLQFKATLSSSQAEADAIIFPIVEYTVNTLPAEFPVPKLTQATGTGTSVTLAPLNAQNGATVSVEYTPMYTTDSIKVTMVGTAGAGSPVIPAKNGVTTGKVTFDITKAAIAANVGNANKTLTLKYDVTRSGKVVASKVLTVTVTPIPTTELAKTVIRINEADAATKVLDLSGSVTNKTLRVGSWPFIASFQPVAMLLSGFKADGSVHELQVWTLASNAVTAGWFSNGFYDQRVAASYFLELGHDTKLKLQFKATLSSSQAEADAIIFPIVEYTVNTLPAEFPVPKLTQATGTGTSVTLAPLNAQNGGTVSVEYTPMYTTDSIKVTMVGTAGAGSPVIPAKNGVTAGKVTFDITKAAIAANVGNANKTVTLDYEVARNGKVISSKVLTVTVTPIPQAELAKTVLQINQANAATRVLDLDQVAGNITGEIGVWPFITAPYPVWLRLLGKTDKGVDHSLTVYNGAGSAAVNPTWIAQRRIQQAIFRSYLNGLGDGTKLQMELKAVFSPSKAEADAIRFPVVEYIVATKVNDLTTFEHGPNTGWYVVGGSMRDKVIDGNRCGGLLFDTNSNGHYKVIYKTYYNLRMGKTYQLSFDVRPENPLITASFHVAVANTYINFRGSFTGASWRHFSGTFRVETSTVFNIQIDFQIPAAANTFIFVDNIGVRDV